MGVTVKAKVKRNEKNIGKVKEAAQVALEKAARGILQDVQNSGTIPFKSGELNNNLTRVIETGNRKHIRIISDGPYARRLYFNPGYKFHRTADHANAGAFWFEPYIKGAKRKMLKEKFTAHLKQESGGVIK